MKKFLFLIIPILLFSSSVLADTLEQSYDINYGNWGSISVSDYYAETFTTAGAYTLSTISVMLFKAGTEGDLTVSLYAANGSHIATGDVLCSGIITQGTVGTDNTGEWYNVDCSASLAASTEYVIQLNSTGQNSSNAYKWKFNDNSSNSPWYTDGRPLNNNVFYNAGNGDFLFKTWSGGFTPPPATTGNGQLSFPMVLIVILAAFALCFIIERGGNKIIDMIKSMYRYRI